MGTAPKKSLRIHCLYSKLVSVGKLKPHPKNRNYHPKDQIERLAKILKYQGIRVPIVVSKESGFIVKGHGTLEAIKKCGEEKAPVVYQSFANPKKEYTFVQSDNAIAAWAELDLSSIELDIKELGKDFDVDLLGLKDFSVEEEKGLIEDDEVPEAKGECFVKSGDLFILGNHRLLCGDSTDDAMVAKLMNGEKADMVFTDPPYGMNLDTDYSFAKNTYSNVKSKGGNKYSKVIGDSEDYNPAPLLELFKDCQELFLWGADFFAERIPGKNEGSWVVWDKRQNNADDDDAATSADKAFGSAFELCWSKTKHKRLFARVRSGIFGVNNEQGNSKRVHPTEKPVQLVEWFFERFGKDSKLIIDLFLGSGSTLIACEKTNRRCFGMEIDPKYCQVIIERWEKYTGKKASLCNEKTKSEKKTKSKATR